MVMARGGTRALAFPARVARRGRRMLNSPVTVSRIFPADDHNQAVARAQVKVARQITAVTLSGHRLVDDAVLVVSELVTNALVHGSNGPDAVVDLRIMRLPGTVYLTVTDDGRPQTAPCVHTPAEAGSESGRGLAIVHQLAWRCWTHRRHGGGHRIHVLLRTRRVDEPTEPAEPTPDLEAFLTCFPEPDTPDNDPTTPCRSRSHREGW